MTGVFISKKVLTDDGKKNEDYNKELVDPIIDFITVLNSFAFLANVALCFICYKYLNVTTVLVYIENVVAILISLNVAEQ